MFLGVTQRAALAFAGTAAVIGAHLSLTDVAVVVGAIIYIVSIIRDWRPVKTLREENRELRAEVETERKRGDELERKYEDLEKRYQTLEQSRDFSRSFAPLERAIDQARSDTNHEHEKIVHAIETLEKTAHDALNELVKGLSQNSAVIGTLAAGINAGTLAEK